MTTAQPGQEQRMERGDLRMIFTDGAGLASPSMQRELGEDVWAIIGPIGKHTSHPELQDALGLVCMAFNRRHGRLSAEKHAEIAKGHEAGAALLLEATRPTADLGEDGELVAKLRDDRRRTPFEPWERRTMAEAADRIEQLRKALEGMVRIADCGAEDSEEYAQARALLSRSGDD